MPTLTFANSKGGAGKTTAVALFVSEMMRRGRRTAVIDADPQRWFSQWCERLPAASRPELVGYVGPDTLQKRIEEAASRFDMVVVDLPGIRSPMTAVALALSDHVVIPVQGSAMDAQGAAQVLELLSFLKTKMNLDVPHSVLLSRVNPLVTTRALRAVKTMLEARDVYVLDTPIVERAVFRDMFDQHRLLHEMEGGTSGRLDRALENAFDFVDELLMIAARSRPANDTAPRPVSDRVVPLSRREPAAVAAPLAEPIAATG